MRPDQQPDVGESSEKSMLAEDGLVFREECQRRGAEVRRFGLADGWDFSKAKHRRALLELQMEEEPDEIFMSPKCTLWSAMQSINVKTEEDCIELQEKRTMKYT